MTLFEHLNNLFTKKKKWSTMTEAEKKTFSVFMVNKFLSMDMTLTPLVNIIQECTYSIPPGHVYEIYMNILPERKNFFVKYIKGKKESQYNPKLIELLKNHYQLSKTDIEDMLDVTTSGVREVVDQYGMTEKEIDKLLKMTKSEE